MVYRWLAARELKRQSWRFHKQYLTWFQRAHNPQAITEDYEQGGYFYFDWENSWCQRKKSDFRFEVGWTRSIGEWLLMVCLVSVVIRSLRAKRKVGELGELY